MAIELAGHAQESFSIEVLGLRVLISCPDPETRKLLAANFGAMASLGSNGMPELQVSVQRDPKSTSLSIARLGRAPTLAADSSDLLYALEKLIVVELQRRRTDLLFLHAAAISLRGRVCLLAADSGAGKSTTTWAMLHHGFEYLTDELSAVDVRSLCVMPYPHAICLKRPPPHPYVLPTSAVDLGRTIHIPADALPGLAASRPRPLGAVFLLNYRPDVAAPELRTLGPAEASAHLYRTALNALAHEKCGLDAVAQIAERVPCFALTSARMPETCSLVRAAFDKAITAIS